MWMLSLIFAATLGGTATIRNATLAPGVSLVIYTPTNSQVFQRLGSVGTIYIDGVMIGPAGTFAVEARFNGGSWQAVGSFTAGAFTATLTNQAQGQGNVDIRPTNFTDSMSTITNVGIGDVFLIAGQSNAQGRGSNNQSYAHAALRAGMFGNDYAWKNLADPTDSNTGQIDTVSSDANSGGSAWPLLSSYIMTNQAVPVAFIPCALSGSGITQWLAGASHTNRATLYGSMMHRGKHAIQGGVKAVLWWQGETDALNSMSTAAYYSNLTLFASNVFTDLGVKVMPCKLQNSSGIDDGAEAAINTAIGNAWTSNATVITTGPDLTGLATDDEYHLRSDLKMVLAASNWWVSASNAFYAAASFPSGTTHYWAFQNDLVDGPGTCDLGSEDTSFVAGKNGQCLEVLDGGNASSSSCGLPATTAFSVSFWVFCDGGGSATMNWTLGTDGVVIVGPNPVIGVKVGATADTIFSVEEPAFDQWHLIVVTYDGSSVQKLSIDGGTFVTGSVTVEGTGGDATWTAANGFVRYDEFATWTRALTQQEVADLWNGGTGLFQ